MASEITYAEVRFKNELKSSGTNSDSPAAPKENTTPLKSNPAFPKLLLGSLLILFLLLAILFFVAFIIFFNKYSQLLEEKNYKISTKTSIHTNLKCVRNNSTMEGKVWTCCPEKWKSFSSSCYFFSTDAKSWNDSQENCSRMEAHLVVINNKEEQDFLTQNMDKNAAYFMGLSDPEGEGRWQWVDQTPYNQSATFWHPGEPSHSEEHCVIVNHPSTSLQWGWNNILCKDRQRSVCEMMKIYL
ncbi:C-type lectin domain family 4 member A [Ictidomys tridecemlineatus]|uniref:C-type lectin domain-containing protein n=1 Tax=Ictidomys tridecemlineatus TaxID=43179 RepID=I3MH05_ICTTR|nr:C-type lectin domain family 4 member A isoform X1 [Ictidomys tridecemlineatus]XP_040136939.1 C-type lectin domain family 4 member A isoform X1 [Ictidomys tridecemlineatus]KAG3292448.1 C-type lectin domain family 4 member A [Ictidomys tridecemlineatus]